MNFGIHEAIYLFAGVAIGWWVVPWMLWPVLTFIDKLKALLR